MFSHINKMVGSLVGGAVGIGLAWLGLDALFDDPATQAQIANWTAVIMAALGTYIAPKNAE